MKQGWCNYTLISLFLEFEQPLDVSAKGTTPSVHVIRSLHGLSPAIFNCGTQSMRALLRAGAGPGLLC